MNAEGFVAALKEFVGEVAVRSVLKTLESPPGRRPSAELVHMSKWFLSLPQADRDVVTKIVTEAARGTLFGMLAVLDGVRKIDDENGHYVLLHHGPAGDICLNGPNGPNLHELLYW